jgi:hypothetical protein
MARKRITISVNRMEDGRYCVSDGIWAYGTGPTFRSALRDYADSVLDHIRATSSAVGPGLSEDRRRYLEVIDPKEARPNAPLPFDPDDYPLTNPAPAPDGAGGGADG